MSEPSGPWCIYNTRRFESCVVNVAAQREGESYRREFGRNENHVTKLGGPMYGGSGGR